MFITLFKDQQKNEIKLNIQRNLPDILHRTMIIKSRPPSYENPILFQRQTNTCI